MMIDAFLMFYYFLFIPLIMLSIFLYQHRFGFEVVGLKSAFQRCLLWTLPLVCLLVGLTFYIAIPSDGGPPGPGDGILLAIIMFPALIILTLIVCLGFVSGYRKVIPKNDVLKNKPLNLFMVSLNALCVMVLFAGAYISYKK